MKKLCLVLGDQLTPSLSSILSLEQEDIIIMAEVYSEASYVKHHPQKIALIFSAMRHFAKELRQAKYQVLYYKLDDPKNTQGLPQQMLAVSEEHQVFDWVITEPGEWRLQEEFQKIHEESPLNIKMLEDDRFVVSQKEFQQFLSGRKQPRMEHFYRQVRKRTGLLMDGSKPVGGKWNYDHDNRKKHDGSNIPPRLKFDHDEITTEVLELVRSRFSDHFGSLKNFIWPVNRQQALEALSDFIQRRLAKFGDYQDALVLQEDSLYHSLLSSSLNIGLLLPLELCQAAEQAYVDGLAPLNAVEGFIRQIIGWREYVRGLYWAYMPRYAQLNELEAKTPLPAFYWDENLTSMTCMSEAIRNTRENGYAHHIQRLMVTGNFALIYGANIEEVCDWYLAVYVDAFEWVELPNTLGMALFADGGIMASKPYCSSGKYINRMSNYCKSCPYSVQETLGEKACPFNVFYWEFLIKHQERFSQNPRMALILKHVKKMALDKQKSIVAQATILRERILQTGSERTINEQKMANYQREQGEQGELF